MIIRAIACYRSKSDEWTEEWSKSDYRCRNLILAVKGSPFKGYANFEDSGGASYLVENTPAGQDAALRLAGNTMAHLIREAGYQNASIVPIPSSSHTDPCGDFTGLKIARIIQQNTPAFIASPILHFSQVMPKSSTGGGRNPRDIQAKLRLTGLPTGGPIILIDDVFTSGAHMRAAARYLRTHGQEVKHAFVVGRTVWEKPANMAYPPPEELEV